MRYWRLTFQELCKLWTVLNELSKKSSNNLSICILGLDCPHSMYLLSTLANMKSMIKVYYNPPTIHCYLEFYFDHQKIQQSFRYIIWFFHMNWKILRTLVKVNYLVINFCSHMEKTNEISMRWNFKKLIYERFCIVFLYDHPWTIPNTTTSYPSQTISLLFHTMSTN